MEGDLSRSHSSHQYQEVIQELLAQLQYVLIVFKADLCVTPQTLVGSTLLSEQEKGF